MTIYDCPAMSWSEFLNIPNGETVFNHGASECVALANQYNEGVLGGGFVQVGSALQWWTNTNVADVHGFSRIDSAPQVGDIFIASGDLYDNYFGHIGVVVRAWDGSTFGTMEQNVGGEYVSRHDRTMANVDGFLRPINQSPITPPAPSLLGNQRQAGEGGANRRAAPSASAELLEPNLEPNEVGNFVNFAHAEDPYGTGNDVWFQGVSGNWFYSGAFTDAGTHDLTDVTVQAPVPEPTPEPTPGPTPEPTPKPSVKPENIEHKKTTRRGKPTVKPENIEHRENKMAATPTARVQTPEEIQAYLAKQGEVAGAIQPIHLGNIIKNDRARRTVWSIYGIIGLVIVGTVGGLQMTSQLAPEWFMFVMGTYAALGPAFSSLAVANISNEPAPKVEAK